MRSACESGAAAAVETADTGCFLSGNPDSSQFDSLNPSVFSVVHFFLLSFSLPSFSFLPLSGPLSFPSFLRPPLFSFPLLSLPPPRQLPFSLNSIWATLGTSSSDSFLSSPHMHPIDHTIIIITTVACQVLGPVPSCDPRPAPPHSKTAAGVYQPGKITRV